MKQITCIIQPYRLDEVKDGLEAIGVHGLTVTEVRGFGRQKGHKEIYRGQEYFIAFAPKCKIEIVVADEQVDAVIEMVTQRARTGNIGDGKIFVHDIEKVVRIRTGETDIEAL